MKIFGREPAFWIGLIVTVVLFVISTLSSQGVISQALGGKLTDATTTVSQLLILIAPLITGLLIRPASTSVAAPSLPAGTTVTVIQPGSTPNTTATV